MFQFEKEENMNVELTWKNGYTGRDVVVAIVDDGVWYNNSDILPNYVSTLFYLLCSVRSLVILCD